MGGYFKDADGAGYAYIGYNNYGVYASGAGYFEATTGESMAWISFDDVGIQALGYAAGGYFLGNDIGWPWAYVGQTYLGTDYKIRGTGTVSFVQNHPERSDRTIVYAAPEGDEVGVYTRGRARLAGGEARVALGESFKWVANPEIGLTVHLTPRGDCLGLYAETVTTEELVVRELGGGTSDVAFDYLVSGLRLGYEQMAPVQDKRDYAPVPELDATDTYYAENPELRRYNALERFAAMRADLGVDGPLDLSRTRELVAAVNRFDPETDAALLPEAARRARARGGRAEPGPESEATVTGTDAGPPDNRESSAQAVATMLPVDAEGNVYARSFRPSAADFATLTPVAEPVEAGDVLVIDPETPGQMSLARQASDPRAFGIVAADPGLVLGSGQPDDSGTERPGAETEPYGAQPSRTSTVSEVPVAHSGVTFCKADAGYGSIQPGDLLTTSPTPGHAMRSDEPVPGTIIGKALESLDAGTGSIRVLVTLR
jgi:hypothetical protein